MENKLCDIIDCPNEAIKTYISSLVMGNKKYYCEDHNTWIPKFKDFTIKESGTTDLGFFIEYYQSQGVPEKVIMDIIEGLELLKEKRRREK